MIPLDTLNYTLAFGTVIMQVVTIALVIALLFRHKLADLDDVIAHVGKWGLWIGFLLTLAGSVMTLYYSEVLGFAPCGLCWLQRVFLYPQVVLFAMALWKKGHHIADYAIGLSIVGGIIALYQHYLQMGGESVAPCPAVATAATDCASRILFEFGYVTFPLMSATLFAFIVVVMFSVRRHSSTL
jgi:disulfide bond formation protein DsbB